MTEAPSMTSRSECRAALLWGLATAVERPARTIWFADRDFADWPLDQPALLSHLTAWVRLPQRKLVVLAASFDSVERMHPRFVDWRRLWSHAVDAMLAPEPAARTLPSLLVDDGPVSVHLIDNVIWRGRASVERPTAQRWRDRLDAVLQHSESGFPVNRLGL